MSTIKLKAPSGGSVSLVAEDTVSDVVFTIPATPGSIVTTAALAAPTGSGLVGYMPAGVGAVAGTAQGKLRESVRVSDFGAVADWNGITGTNNTTAFLAAFTYIKSIGGGTMYVTPGDYYFGDYATSVDVVGISDLINTHISAYGARFLVNTTAEASPFLFVFTNPNNVVLAGARFFDVGFNPLSWTTHSRWGMGAVRLDAAVASKGFKLVDCQAENLTYLIVADLRANKRKMSNISVVDCRVKNSYYGVDMIYAGNDLKIDNLICEDVRRGYIGFGTRNADIDIKLYTNSGFFGSNAFISLCCEGITYDDGYGVLGAEGNVENVRINLNVTGYEAHTNYVHLYHQQDDSAGYIQNIDADVKINNLSAVGKNVGISDTNVFMFDHELPSTAILGSTTRKFKQISLSGGIIGAVTGFPIVVSSANSADKHTIALSDGLTPLIQNLTVNQLTTDINWFSPFERPLPTLIPVGATTVGVVTGLVSAGTYTVIGKRVFFNAQLSWTGHTGTGQLRINGLPLAANTTSPSVPLPVLTISCGGLAHTAGSALTALLGGSGNNQIMLYDESAGGQSLVPVDAVVGALYISGSYLAA